TLSPHRGTALPAPRRSAGPDDRRRTAAGSPAEGGIMTPSVSTSCRSVSDRLWLERLRAAVADGVVGDVVLPAAPHDSDPGASQDTNGVGMVFAVCAGALVDVCGPGTVESAVGSEGRDGDAEAFVAAPSERNA